MATELLLYGRIVQGGCSDGSSTNIDGNPIVIKSGPNAGQPGKNFFIGLAVSKSDPELQSYFDSYAREAQAGHPDDFGQNGDCTYPGFAWKYIDGDSQMQDKNGNRQCDKEGFPGNYVFGFSQTCLATTGVPFPVYDTVGASGNVKRLLPNHDKYPQRGDYVRIYTTVEPNPATSKTHGLYTSIEGIEFIKKGQPISTGRSATEMFGGANKFTGGSGQGTSQATPQPIATNAVPAAQTTTGGVTPSTGFMQAPAPEAPAPTAEARYKIANGQEFSESDLRAAGWNDHQLQTQATKVN